MSSAETFISVDIEASGPVPGEFSMLAIGACAVDDPDRSFQCLVRPISDRADPAALAVTGMTLEELEQIGLPPADAMQKFEAWALSLLSGKSNLVFLGFNAAFDWSFVNYYFHRFLGRNPFGFSPLDIKAYYMGATDCTWRETKSSAIAERVHPTLQGTHDALEDARYQAELFRLIRTLKSSH